MNKIDRTEFVEINDEQKDRIEQIRINFRCMFDMVDSFCKPSRETSLGITKIEEAMFWLIKGISREEKSDSNE